MSSLFLLETDYKCDECGRDSGYCKHCSESAFDKSNDEEMSEMSFKEYPVRVKKKVRKRRVENYRHQRQKIMANAISWWRCFCFFYWHWRKRRAYKQLHSHPISEYNAMHKYFIPFIPLHDFLSHIKRYIVYIFLSKIFPFSVSFRGHEKFKK